MSISRCVVCRRPATSSHPLRPGSPRFCIDHVPSPARLMDEGMVPWELQESEDERPVPWWTSADGRTFDGPSDFDDMHLMNMVPYLAKRAVVLCCMGRDDLMEFVVEKRKACIQELRRRRLPVEDTLEKDINELFSRDRYNRLKRLIRDAQVR